MSRNRKKASSSEPGPLPKLLVPRRNAQNQIATQVEKGRQLLRQPIRSEGDLEHACAQYEQWDDYNARMLSKQFDSPEVANLYGAHYGGTPVVGSTLDSRVAPFHASVQEKVRRLESLGGRLHLYDEASPAVVPTPGPGRTNDIFVVEWHDEGAEEAVERSIEKFGPRATTLDRGTPMTREDGSRWVKAGVVLGILSFLVGVLGLVPKWVPFLEERPHLVWWVGAALELLTHWWRLAFSAGVLLLLGYAAWSFRYRLGGCLRQATRNLKRIWAWIVWDLLSRPARDELMGMIAARRPAQEATDHQTRIPPINAPIATDHADSDDVCQAGLGHLKAPALIVLHVALQKYEQAGGDPVRVGMNDLRPLWPGVVPKLSPKVVRNACRELKWAGLIKKHLAFAGKAGSGVSFALADGLKERGAARRLRESCGDELVERGVWDF
jgi:hypothetical protein